MIWIIEDIRGGRFFLCATDSRAFRISEYLTLQSGSSARDIRQHERLISLGYR